MVQNSSGWECIGRAVIEEGYLILQPSSVLLDLIEEQIVEVWEWAFEAEKRANCLLKAPSIALVSPTAIRHDLDAREEY